MRHIQEKVYYVFILTLFVSEQQILIDVNLHLLLYFHFFPGITCVCVFYEELELNEVIIWCHCEKVYYVLILTLFVSEQQIQIDVNLHLFLYFHFFPGIMCVCFMKTLS